MSTSAENNRLARRGTGVCVGRASMPGAGSPAMLLSALLAALPAGCAVGPAFHRPQAPADTRYSAQADPVDMPGVSGNTQRLRPGAPVPSDWWRLFHSPRLEEIVAEANRRNPGVEAAQASLRASRDDLRSGYGIFFPSVDVGAGAVRERLSTIDLGEHTPGAIFNLFTLSASVSYALDVFGGQRRMIEGLKAGVDLADANERATRLSLEANVVNTVIARAAYRAQIAATRELIDTEKEQVRLATVQSDAGTVAYSSVLSLRGQLAAFEATIPQLEQKAQQSDDLLSTLCGHTPAEWHAPEVALADLRLPAELPLSLPSELVRQRPDILAAEAAAHAASANIGVATAAMLPNITLSAAAAAAGNSSRSLFPATGKSWSIGADATAPLFQGGTLWFKRKAAVESYHQAMADYRQTVLGALAQVADTLGALAHDASSLVADEDALAAATQALGLLRANYEAGLVTYLEVLNADAQFAQANINDIQALGVRYQDSVALFAALGGGWWNGAADAAGVKTPDPHP